MGNAYYHPNAFRGWNVMRHREFADAYADRFVRLCLNEEVKRVRPSFADRVDLSWLRQVTAALLSYSEDARFWAYDVGRYAGNLLASRLKERGILTDFLEGRIHNQLGIFKTQHLSKDQNLVTIAENVFSSGLPNLGIKFDWYLAGVLGSLFSEMTGKRMGARELECYANGAPSCIFQIQPADIPLDSGNRNSTSDNWSQALQSVANEYLFRSFAHEGRAVIRPILGDAVDVSLLRLVYGALFTYSPEVRTLLYAIGRRAGAIMGSSMPEAAKAAMLSGAMKMKDEESGFSVEKKGESKFLFHIPECPAHGEPNIGEAAGYLESGFAAGMFEVLLGKPVGAKEILCPAKGDAECVFELRVLE